MNEPTLRARTIEWNDPALTVRAVDGRTGLDFLRAIAEGAVPQPPIGATLRFALVAVNEGFARFEGTPDESLLNPMGIVHGGWGATLLDSAMGCAVMTALDAKNAYATAQLATHFIRPITLATGKVIAEGRLIHRGRQVATAEGKLLDARGTLLAHGTTTCSIFPRP